MHMIANLGCFCCRPCSMQWCLQAPLQSAQPLAQRARGSKQVQGLICDGARLTLKLPASGLVNTTMHQNSMPPNALHHILARL